MKNSHAKKNSHGGDFEISDIFQAIKDIDCDLIKEILDENPEELFVMSYDKEYPLSYACFIGNMTSAEALFEFIDPQDPKYSPMLDKALVNSLALGHTALIDLVNEKVIGWERTAPTPNSPTLK